MKTIKTRWTASRRREALHSAILAASPDGVAALSLEGAVQMASPKMLTLLGLQHEDELVGRMFGDYIAGPAGCQTIGSLLCGEISGPLECLVKREDGNCFAIELNSALICSDQNSPCGLVVICRDISRRKKAEEALRRSCEVQTVLKEIAEAAITSLSLAEFYPTVHRLLGKVLPAQYFHINLHDRRSGEIVVPFSADEITFIPKRRPIDKGLTEYIMNLGKAVYITPTELEQLIESGEYALAKVQKVKPRHYLGAPLIGSDGTAFGVISLILQGDSQRFSAGDIEVFSIIAAQVALAIERKQAQAALEDWNRRLEVLSFTDSLTGIANRRRFDEVLEVEHERHCRKRSTLSVILLDIDFFKNYNDEYGHVRGDECLRQVGQTLARCVNRSADLVARYGGEEFACLLPETGRNGVMVIAEKVRQAIEELKIPHRRSKISAYVTVSIGAVAVHRNSGKTALDIMRKADELLYRAKRAGRNRVAYSVFGKIKVLTGGLKS